MSALELPDDFRDLLVELADADVEFVLIGGWAMAVHGRPRATDDLDVFIPHQANGRINELVANQLELRPDVVIANDIEFTGNTSAASVPLAMEQLLACGAAKPGALALLLGYGAGLTYAAQVVRLPEHPR